MTFHNPCNLPDNRLADIAAALRPATVGQLLEWARLQPTLFSAPGVLSDVIVQDEFTHDVVVGLTNGLVLVYGST
jgi:hypothetical protein